ncbi:LuxR C-terminal-related transcriptional regulator [Adlercreutzia sp. ZJ304]|uniref:helix-turn-helix transcriptional regulator n=1 Tax=Adlercreutzia sp. ZJ304 TaxID=2709791 RepID=UPI0013E9C3C0|nr:LuxR C-terminal-related transcriptional regulator [Adlercreutzia sp. ZJ304]
MNHNAASTAMREHEAKKSNLSMYKVAIVISMVAAASTFLSSALITKLSKKADDRIVIKMKREVQEYNARIEELRLAGSNLARMNSQTIIHMYYALHAQQLARFGLTEREIEIATKAVLGESSTSIAKQMFVSQSTIRHSLGSVYKKTGTKNCQELRSLIRARIQQEDSSTYESNKKA